MASLTFRSAGGIATATINLYSPKSTGAQMLRAIIAILIALLPAHARAEARIALLIGNKDYKPGVGALINPFNDIRMSGRRLRPLGSRY